MPSFLHQLRTWLTEQRWRVWLGQQDNTPAESKIVALPPALREKLTFALRQLPPASDYVQAIHQAFEDAFQVWLTMPQVSNNVLVVLGSPVTDVAQVLTANVDRWVAGYGVPVQMLQWQTRPHHSLDIASKLKQQLGRGVFPAEHQSRVMVIPNLHWCFVRSVAGLTAIDYLEEGLLNDPSRFWLLGIDPIAWQYLNAACSLEAYCGAEFQPPALDGEQLQAWLSPLLSEFGIEWAKFLTQAEQSAAAHYFNRLATLTEGQSQVAAQVFLRSLTPEQEESDFATQPAQLRAQTPSLPPLPEVSNKDDYLLYSLLLHSEITIEHLAESLGESPPTLKHQIQALRRLSLVQQQGNCLSIDPIHYPHLKQKLALNNFAI